MNKEKRRKIDKSDDRQEEMYLIYFWGGSRVLITLSPWFRPSYHFFKNCSFENSFKQIRCENYVTAERPFACECFGVSVTVYYVSRSFNKALWERSIVFSLFFFVPTNYHRIVLV